MDAPRLLDLTRTLRRAGRVATGIDRVERAYLSHFVEDDAPVFGLCRTSWGYLLLDRDGLRRFQAALSGGTSWGALDRLSRLSGAQAAESDLRRWAVGRAIPLRLGRLLGAHLPDGFDYYNVGHSNLTKRVLTGVKAAKGRVHVMVHDVIPLTHPAFQREGTVTAFEEKMRLTARMADRIIYNSHDTHRQAEPFFANWGRVPPFVVAHLGVPVAEPELQTTLPSVPYFVAVGTIEPRKNYGFLLDLWDKMGADAPLLLICGNRGWNNADVFARLDQLPANAQVSEMSNLNDGSLAALVQGAQGLLFPSLAEGYGLPPIEALALKTPILCNDLQVLHEVLGLTAHFAPVSEPDLWLKTITNWKDRTRIECSTDVFQAPTWEDHFKVILSQKQ